MDIRIWKDAAIDWFKDRHATDKQWEEMAEALLDRSEGDGLQNGLDDSIFNHACYKGAAPDQLAEATEEDDA